MTTYNTYKLIESMYDKHTADRTVHHCKVTMKNRILMSKADYYSDYFFNKKALQVNKKII